MKPLPAADATLTCENGHVLYVGYKTSGISRDRCHVCNSGKLTLKRIPSSEE